MTDSPNKQTAGLACRVLVVDDEEYFRKLIQEILLRKNKNFQIHTASSGEEALDILARHPVDIMLTDLNMPGMNGLELLSLIRGKYPKLQTLVISGQGEVDSAVRAMELGATRYLQKPVKLKELCLAIQKVENDLFLIREVEEKKTLQIQLQQAQKLEAVGQLAAGIAHEINTPTQYVGTNINFLQEAFRDITKLINHFRIVLAAAKAGSLGADVLREAEKALAEADWDYLAEEIPMAISQSKDGVKRVTTIVRAMKEFSHPGGKEKVAADLNKLIETTVTVARNEWKYVAEVKTDLDKELPLVPCLTDQINQVFLNMLVNAAQAIAEKLGENPVQDKGLIDIKTSHDKDWVEVTIGDSGAGIPAAVIKRIFDPFFTTKEVGKGTGQGLAIAFDVINKHKGTITCESEPGKGTKFTIRLPTNLVK